MDYNRRNSPNIRMKNILVTGGAGFIGSNFIHHILAKSQVDHVTNLDALTYAGNLDNLLDIQNDERYHFNKMDISELEGITDLLQNNSFDTVVHFAAESHVDRSIRSPMQFIQTNIVGTANLLKNCLAYWENLDTKQQRKFRFLHISTDEVFGSLKKDETPFSESTPYAPNSPYAASKAASDHLVRAYFHTYQFPAIITNCSNNYGPYQFPEKLIPVVILNAKQGQPIQSMAMACRSEIGCMSATTARRYQMFLKEGGLVKHTTLEAATSRPILKLFRRFAPSWIRF